ncbi:type II toxin-antitoxin system HicA family toxin [Allostella humosa]|uniref:type II toxin-antitoxin system HicA family toxin n=1 Tax=Stella humosa TaxID=94 RepID=UPI003B833365
MLLAHGFVLVRQKGSHRQYRAEIKGALRLVTLSCADNDEPAPGTLAAIVRQSALDRALFR